MIITFKNVSFRYNEKELLNNVNFSITDNDKVGLVGFNGCGKTTILKLIIGEINPNSGTIVKSGNIKINYLAQEPIIPTGIRLLDYVLSFSTTDHKIEIYEAKTVLTKLKLDPNGLTDHLSGGQKKRLALAKVMVSYCDYLILDEPTNHLDNDMILYLEKYLARFNHGIFMVTHDRYFLERCCNTMFELDNAKIYAYKANYSEFLKLKEERLEREEKEAKRIKAIMRTDLEWMNRGVEARRTKQKARIERFKEMSKIKFSERKDFSFESLNTYLGRNIIEIKAGYKAFNDKVLFEDFNISVLRHDHIGITGDNGCGKTTLFKIIMQEETLDRGILSLGETLNIGYFSQHFDAMNGQKRVIDYILEETNEIETLDGKLSARALLEKFLFDGAKQYSYINSLSGGEKRRLQLVKVLAKNPNVLLLDEPTNDLDIYTIEILENYLNSFMGPILCVSHDRFFLDKVCDRILYYDNSMIKSFNGTFSEFLELDSKATNLPNKKVVFEKPKKLIFSYNEKREFEALDKEIPILEARIKEVTNDLSKETINYEKILILDKELKELEVQYEIKSTRYLELLEKQEL